MNSSLSVSIHDSTASIPSEVWNGLLPSTGGRPDNPFLDHAFLLALEDAGCATPRTGWAPQHLLISDGGTTKGLLPLYLKSHSQGEYVFDHGWADAFERAGGRYYPKLQSAVPFTPATAPKLLTGQPDSEISAALLEAAAAHCHRLGVSSVHMTFVPKPEQELAAARGWLIREDTQFHWTNQSYQTFENFLDTLSSRKRKAIRRERRDALADGIEIKWLTGTDLREAHWDAFFGFYMDTGSRKWGRPYLNRKFFSLISAAMSDRIVLMLAYDGDEPIAGALNFVGNDIIYGRYWGTNREVPFLHFELCYYQAIDYAIANKLGIVEAGAQGEHKLARGYSPVLTHSAHWIEHRGLRTAIEDYLEHERRAVVANQSELEHYTPYRRGERSE